MEKRSADPFVVAAESLYELMRADFVAVAQRDKMKDADVVGMLAMVSLTLLQDMLITIRSPETLADYLRRVTPNFDCREPKRPLT